MKIYSNRRYVRASTNGSNDYFNVNDSKEVAVDKIIDFLLDNPDLSEGDRLYLHFDDPDDDGNVYLHWATRDADYTTWVEDDLNDRANRYTERTGKDATDYLNRLYDKIWRKNSSWLIERAKWLYDDIMDTIGY